MYVRTHIVLSSIHKLCLEVATPQKRAQVLVSKHHSTVKVTGGSLREIAECRLRKVKY